MLAAFVRWLIRLFPLLSYDYRHSRIKRRQICPACGNKVRVEMRFDPVGKVVVCGCPICLSNWAYNPVVKSEVWAKTPRVEE